MKSSLLALTLAALSVTMWSARPAVAQDTKVARGTIASMSGSLVTVTVDGKDMAFRIDDKTEVEARGGSTKSAKAAAAGKPGVHVDELLRTGQAVAVTYSGVAGTLHASAIKAIPKVGASEATADSPMTSTGIVKSAGVDWLTITGNSGGGASFDQKFRVDASTKVFAKGVSTAMRANGGRAPFTNLIASGDHVIVTYRKIGDTLLASDIRVTMKAAG